MNNYFYRLYLIIMKINKNYHFKFFLLCISSLSIIFYKTTKIKIAFHYESLKNGGAQRVTALLINKSRF